MKNVFSIASALALTLVLSSSSVEAQSTPAPAPAAAVPAVPAAPADAGAVKSQNIFEVKPDASQEPGYAMQTNGERAKVQPGNNAPMWRQVGSGVAGYSSLPKAQAPEAGVLIQPFVQYPGSRLTNAGEAWRQVRNNWIIPYGGSLVLLVLIAIALFHWRIGPMKVTEPYTGRKVERFTPFERAAHWTNAIAFCILAISGLIMAFGKFFLLPVMGLSLFGWLTYLLKNVHNFAGPVFTVSLLVVIITFMRDNLPAKGDVNWMLKGGGILSGQEIKSGRFNAGEKVTFWGGVFVLGLIAVVTGLFLNHLLPVVAYDRSNMQIALMVHAVSNVMMICMFLGHIYMGTIGTKDAYEGMRTGYVDEGWAKEHHALWLDDIKSGKIPAQRSSTPVPGQPVQV
ncbi:formate dehydrogenase subunit gamma [Rhodoferax ferrireducens]|uniref:formate dehydrogenase subunit gamma n=1 Tax=Rhodoferax ferrireducens TaxID=192843 RepID=UPI00298E991B|nr:formate dehydrogenase subunit gamma [Rhodoferax ferrireducens]WPC66046.1 formate dehydrogenase subunit gamma [Rhodoferax ferrireducens]